MPVGVTVIVTASPKFGVESLSAIDNDGDAPPPPPELAPNMYGYELIY